MSRRLIDALSDVHVRSAKPRPLQYKLSDGRGLYLLVKPSGGKFWRLNFRYAGKPRLAALGAYPDTTLASARVKAAEARELVRQGIDPVQHKREQKAARENAALQTFSVVAAEWIAKKAKKWTEGHLEQTHQSLRDYVFPRIGKRPIAALTAQDVKRVLDPLEEAGKAETLRRVRQRVNAVFSYAVQTGLRPDNPVREMRGAYDAPVREHFASITPKELPAFLVRLGQYRGHESTIGLIRMILWTACRTAEIRGAVWSEFDLDEARWTIPAARMKKRRPHVVPLPSQAVALLRRLEPLRMGDYVLPSQGRPDAIASENIVLQALKKMGYGNKLTGHGLRAAVATGLEEMGYPTEVIKAQLSHAKANLTDAAYLRGQHVEKRAAMMQVWADHLDGMPATGKVVSMTGKQGQRARQARDQDPDDD